jgi:hypothetical protein
MSGQVGGQVRALPFTGFATLPMLVLGAALSAIGVLMTWFKSKSIDS